MNNWTTVFLLGFFFLQCSGRDPFKVRVGSLPFMVYYASRYRGLCTGSLVSRVAVLSAAVCVLNPNPQMMDTRPINVVLGTTYRHPRRGVRVQVIKIIIPKISTTPMRIYELERSVSILLLKHSVPDIMTEVPVRALKVDYLGEEELKIQEECLTAGWHFFHKEDEIYPVQKFLLQRNLRGQFLNNAKKSVWCEALTLKYRKALSNKGYQGMIKTEETICTRDPDRRAQPCHGAYGSPLICKGRLVAMLTAPDAQWTNCTGFTSIYHVLSSMALREYFSCVSSVFQPGLQVTWSDLKVSVYEGDYHGQYDYVHAMYDHVYKHKDEFGDPEESEDD